MSRKNLLANITAGKLTAVNSSEAAAKPAPAAFMARGAFGAVTRTIDDLAAKAQAAREIEARLTAGEAVVDLDTALIEASFVADRLSLDDDEFQSLLAAMKARGQDSPILVRPHPQTAGRYQVAFGHRRLRAARALDRPVRAVVRLLSDRDLILAQGQENSARANLSFIERALFAGRLESAGYDRETIMGALSIDKTTASRMISVATKIPGTLIEAIGAAPVTGRDRWIELAACFQAGRRADEVALLLASAGFAAAPSDERFNRALVAFTPAPASDSKGAARVSAAPELVWATETGAKVACVRRTKQAFALSIDQRLAPGFGDYLLSQMDHLYAAYLSQRQEE